MFKIRLNIEKCGGFEKLLVMGGTPTKNYLDKTRDMLKVFLLVYQLEYMLTTEADIAEAVAIARGYDVEPFIRSASWGELVKEADCLREAFVDRWFERAQKRAQVALPLAG